MRLHIIYTEGGVLLSKRDYASWREIQDAHEDFKTSLGPWEQEVVVGYLDDEYPDLDPPAREQVGALVAGEGHTRALAFRAT